MKRPAAAMLLASVLAAATAIVPSVASAATFSKTVVASEDAYVLSSATTRNFGNDGRLRVDASPVTRSYLKFNLTTLVGTVTSAKLRLVPAANLNAAFDVRLIGSSAWSEPLITYKNMPAVGKSVGHSPVALRSGTALTFDVTSGVKAGIRSFALTNLGSTSTIQLHSSESTSTSLRPALLVTTTVAPVANGPCGKTITPQPVKHVIWIFMENHGYSQVVGGSAAPFENQLIAQCGLATAYHAITHPSLPNYIAATSGDTQGVTDDSSPAVHPLDVESIFSQVRDAGKTWRSYQESTPANCSLSSADPYAVKHDPAAYYTSIRDDCATFDVPMGTTSGGNLLNDLNANTMPDFAFLTPNLCNDTHDCGIRTGDTWLQDWFTKIVASPGYLDGSTVVFLTWDEDSGAEGNRIPAIVVSPSTPVGRQSATAFSHYSLLKTTEELLGIGTFLGHAGDPGTLSMRSAFNL